jgi:hypothetical protein
MIPDKTLNFGTRNATPITAKIVEGATKETALVCAGQFFIPKAVNVEYVLAAENRRDTTSRYGGSQFRNLRMIWFDYGTYPVKSSMASHSSPPLKCE